MLKLPLDMPVLLFKNSFNSHSRRAQGRKQKENAVTVALLRFKVVK